VFIKKNPPVKTKNLAIFWFASLPAEYAAHIPARGLLVFISPKKRQKKTSLV